MHVLFSYWGGRLSIFSKLFLVWVFGGDSLFRFESFFQSSVTSVSMVALVVPYRSKRLPSDALRFQGPVFNL